MKKSPVTIFVEGNDYKFIQDFVQYHYGISLIIDSIGGIRRAGGWENIKQEKKIFEKSTDQNFQNLVIFDSDYRDKEGGFKRRLAQLEETRTTLSLNYDIFLFPNHQEDGTLETLLERLINPEKRIILDCWRSYEQCLKGHSEQNFTLPSAKSKIYSYLEVQLPNTKEGKRLAKDQERDFKNQDHWHLDHEAGQALKDFLAPSFTSSI